MCTLEDPYFELKEVVDFEKFQQKSLLKLSPKYQPEVELIYKK